MGLIKNLPKKAKKEKTGKVAEKSAKHLKIITKSGEFQVSDLTPPRIDRFGFKESPMTPIQRSFRVQELGNKGCAKKRRLDFDEPKNVLPMPRWSEAVARLKAKRRKVLTGDENADQIRILNLKRRAAVIPNEIKNFRKNNIYRSGILRQESNALLQQKQKSKFM